MSDELDSLVGSFAGSSAQTARNSHYQTTTRLAMEAPYCGAQDISHERLLLEEKMKSSIERTRGTSFTVGGDSMGGEHPCRVHKAQDSRLKTLRSHRSMPAFDTEARLQQRDVEHADLGGMVKDQRSELAKNKITLGRSQVQVGHIHGPGALQNVNFHMSVWNKREDFATTADFKGDHQRFKSKKDSGALWNAECADAYQTESQLIHAAKRPGDEAARASARPDPGQLRAIKLYSTRSHWNVDQRPEDPDPEQTEQQQQDMQHTRRIESVYEAKGRQVSKRNEGLCKRGDHVGAVNPSDIFDRLKLDRARPRVVLGDQFKSTYLTPAGRSPVKEDNFNKKLYTALRRRDMQDSVFALDRLRGGGASMGSW